MSKTDPYLEKLFAVQNELSGIDTRLSALEQGFVAEQNTVDAFLRATVPDNRISANLFLTDSEIASINERYQSALQKGVACDALDYAVAAACGIVSGIIDAVFVKAPHEGLIGKKTDKLVDDAVILLAKKCGWNPKPGNENSITSAIGFFERLAPVGYDQKNSKEVGGAVRHLSPKNHHIKSASHYPDIIGLISSICNQFTNTSTFFDNGKGQIVIVPAAQGGYELVGSTTISKVVAGFSNWLWHCLSDIAGSSGGRGNVDSVGMGLPIPFTEFFQFCNFGKFPNEKGQYQSFATVITEVYEQHYDFRHGVSMSIPVVINDLLISVIYLVRRHFGMDLPWSEAMPRNGSPELQRMMTVGVGSLCLVDLGTAALSSWGNWVKFFSELNLVAWARFGLQGVHELQGLAHREIDNMTSIQDDISMEWERLLAASKDLLA